MVVGADTPKSLTVAGVLNATLDNCHADHD
jgi:hypothetical protein